MNFTSLIQSLKFKVFIIAVLHIVGLLGFLNIIQIENFEKLTPFNLLVGAALMLSHYKVFNKTTTVFLVIIFWWGYLIELVGVKTELIFGTYNYGGSLGVKLFDIPLLIGINWIIMVCSTAAISEKMPFGNIYVKAFLAAILMVLLDFLIEPFAMKYDLWQWANSTIPLQNYMGWFVCGFLMQVFFFRLSIPKNNSAGVWLYIIQALFFLILYFS